MTASEAFQSYAWRSVQADQYYASIRIFAYHYHGLKDAFLQIPKGADWPRDVTCLSESAKHFFVTAANRLNYMGTTNIFSEAPYPELKNLIEDIHDLGFRTCLTFQWALFESFVLNSLLQLADEGFLSEPVTKELHRLERMTLRFLKFIDSGNVLGQTPFRTLLPVAGWVPATENCGFAELTIIINLRNDLIHRPAMPVTLPPGSISYERFYERSMWILRQFAGNVDQDIQRIRGAKP